MDENRMNGVDKLELKLTLPSGRRCRAKMPPTTMGAELVDRLIERGWIEPGWYEFVLYGRIHVDAACPVGELYGLGETSAQAELVRKVVDEPDWPDDYRRMQVLYGCPTAVTDQADKIADCTVTRTEL